jgi:hypothetical protein
LKPKITGYRALPKLQGVAAGHVLNESTRPSALLKPQKDYPP